MANIIKPIYQSQVGDEQILINLKVLIVDDNQDSLDLTAFILEAHGFEVVTVTSALNALEAVEQFQPDALISDLVMPYVDGYSLIRRIRQSKSAQNIPAIAITAVDGQDILELSLEAGFHACLTKPFDEDELINLIVSLYLKLQNLSKVS